MHVGVLRSAAAWHLKELSEMCVHGGNSLCDEFLGEDSLMVLEAC